MKHLSVLKEGNLLHCLPQIKITPPKFNRDFKVNRQGMRLHFHIFHVFLNKSGIVWIPGEKKNRKGETDS